LNYLPLILLETANEAFLFRVRSLLCRHVFLTHTYFSPFAGYPKDMWVARSFIDFVHPQDRETFISQVTENICLTLRDSQSETGGGLPSHQRREYYAKSGSFFCRIRVYNSLKAGFSVKERKTRYTPFKLSVCFKDLSLESSSCNNTTITGTAGGGLNSGSNLGGGGSGGGDGGRTQSTFLFITAIPLSSAFSQPFEDMSNKVAAKPSFVTKHTATCTFSAPIDEASIPYLGFLPQDMNGDDIFNYIHPLDLPLLKEAFEAAMLEQGKPVSSKVIRFRVRNGGYIRLNSWWSSFINPWSRLLEFIHGKHFVLKGPRHPDVFGEPIKVGEGGSLAVTAAEVDTDELDDGTAATAANSPAAFPKEELAKENARVQTEIKNILRRTVQRSTSAFLDAQPNSSTKAKKELSNFMGSLLEVAKAETTKLGRYGGNGGNGIGGKGAGGHHAVIAHISPHQSDSSETPPSYNQLTYNENLTRFFNSQPKTLSEREVQEKYEEESPDLLEDGEEGATIVSSQQDNNPDTKAGQESLVLSLNNQPRLIQFPH
jgi:period circadian protein